VRFVDELVAYGVLASRAEAVAFALTREQRRRTALRDVEILKRLPDDAGMDELAGFLAAHPVDLGD
jgi:hypothetical protein